MCRYDHRRETSINRNIVECKYDNYGQKVMTTVVLIETLWNVNSLVLPVNGELKIVLIETLWNVNTGFWSGHLKSHFVLIETLWNVNLRRIRHWQQ